MTITMLENTCFFEKQTVEKYGPTFKREVFNEWIFSVDLISGHRQKKYESGIVIHFCKSTIFCDQVLQLFPTWRL